eukprot:GFUD01021092.1.p1 GENE.GFUD01021092.1~~GFUD01021092.1.p1  ORF type:complete len:315 (-),score=63.49 GFUD01021092.1:1525-2469(-)
MLGSLKDRIVVLGEGIKSQFGSETEGEQKEAVLGAGAEVLAHFQDGWRRIHEGAEQVSRQADRADREVSRVHAEYEKQWRHVAMLSSLMGQLPTINNEIEGVMRTLGELENLFMEVEVSLLALEDTMDAREAQEKQLEQRFQLAIYQERRRQELEEFESRLEIQYQKKLKEKELVELASKKERQAVFQARFEEDLTRFASTGLLEVPLRRPTDVSLESIDLDADDLNLEVFLKEDCPNLSPLPHDDVPLVKGTLTPNDSTLSPLTIHVQTPSDSSQQDTVGSNSNKEHGSLLTSADESVYFTPDVTLENINLGK